MCRRKWYDRSYFGHIKSNGNLWHCLIGFFYFRQQIKIIFMSTFLFFPSILHRNTTSDGDWSAYGFIVTLFCFLKHTSKFCFGLISVNHFWFVCVDTYCYFGHTNVIKCPSALIPWIIVMWMVLDESYTVSPAVWDNYRRITPECSKWIKQFCQLTLVSRFSILVIVSWSAFVHM